MIVPLLEKQRLNIKEIAWACESEDDLFAFGGHFKIFAMLLKYKAKGLGSDAEAVKWFEGDSNIVANKKRLLSALDEEEVPSIV